MMTFHWIEHIGREALHVVQLGELAPVARRDVLLELFECLASQVAAIHQEHHAARAAEFDQAVDKADGGKSLAAAGRHLDERARAIVRQRPFKIRDRFDLRTPTGQW